MKRFVISTSLLAALIIGLGGCSDKKETQHKTGNVHPQGFENFAHKPKDTSADDRSPIRYQK